MSTRKLSCLGLASVMALSLAAGPVQAAGPAAAAADRAVMAGAQRPVAEVQHRRGRPHFRHRHRRGVGVGLGLGLGILGGIVAAEAYRPRPGYYYDDYEYDGPYYYPSEYQGDAREICARNFRSFEWRTGLYTTYGGQKRLCPYLR